MMARPQLHAIDVMKNRELKVFQNYGKVHEEDNKKLMKLVRVSNLK